MSHSSSAIRGALSRNGIKNTLNNETENQQKYQILSKFKNYHLELGTRTVQVNSAMLGVS
jgi:hypothetical protein